MPAIWAAPSRNWAKPTVASAIRSPAVIRPRIRSGAPFVTAGGASCRHRCGTSQPRHRGGHVQPGTAVRASVQVTVEPGGRHALVFAVEARRQRLPVSFASHMEIVAGQAPLVPGGVR